MVDDEEIELAIRRDPRFMIRVGLLLTLLLVLGAIALVRFGELRVGEHVARGFVTVTGGAPDGGTPEAP